MDDAALWYLISKLNNRITSLERKLDSMAVKIERNHNSIGPNETATYQTRIYKMRRYIKARCNPVCENKNCGKKIKVGELTVSKLQRVGTRFYHYNCLENSRI